jgi:2'-5' RNA ligase
MRLFIAIPLPVGLRKKLHELASGIMDEGAALVREEDMHITLRFLGEVDESGAKRVMDGLCGIRFTPFEAEIRGAGSFTRKGHARVVWIGVDSGGMIEALAQEVHEALNGFPGDERFNAHITIARVRKRCDLSRFIKAHADTRIGPFKVDRFDLMRSALSPKGAEYSIIRSFEGKP